MTTLWLPAIAVAALLAPSSGCRLTSSHQQCATPQATQLDQGCYGYEPTIWRSMSEDCPQTVRMIPEEVVEVPAETPSTVPPAQTKPQAEAPDEPALNAVPEPTVKPPKPSPQKPAKAATEENPRARKIPRIVQPPAPKPDATKPVQQPAKPAKTPEPPAAKAPPKIDKPAAQQPPKAEDVPKPVEPPKKQASPDSKPPAAEIQPPQDAALDVTATEPRPTQAAPPKPLADYQPFMQPLKARSDKAARPASYSPAVQLFQEVQRAILTTPAESPTAAPIGLSRYISD